MLATYDVKGGSFAVASLRQWSRKRLAETGDLASFDLSPDGKRVFALVPVGRLEDQLGENHATFMFNFPDEIRRSLEPVR